MNELRCPVTGRLLARARGRELDGRVEISCRPCRRDRAAAQLVHVFDLAGRHVSTAITNPAGNTVDVDAAAYERLYGPRSRPGTISAP